MWQHLSNEFHPFICVVSSWMCDSQLMRPQKTAFSEKHLSVGRPVWQRPMGACLAPNTVRWTFVLIIRILHNQMEKGYHSWVIVGSSRQPTRRVKNYFRFVMRRCCCFEWIRCAFPNKKKWKYESGTKDVSVIESNNRSGQSHSVDSWKGRTKIFSNQNSREQYKKCREKYWIFFTFKYFIFLVGTIWTWRKDWMSQNNKQINMMMLKNESTIVPMFNPKIM